MPSRLGAPARCPTRWRGCCRDHPQLADNAGLALCRRRSSFNIAHHGYVLSQGRLVAQGTAQELNDNEEVRAAYFG